MVNWTAHTTVQLRHIHDYIAQDSSVYAKRVSEALVQRTADLDKLPGKGRIVSESNEDTIRKPSPYSYRINCKIKSDTLVHVLAVIHKRQHLEEEDIPQKAL